MFVKAGVKYDVEEPRRVKVTNIMEEGIWLKLFIQFDHQSVEQLERDLKKLSSELDKHPEELAFRNSDVFAVVKRNSLWRRVRVLAVNSNEAIVRFMDYGVLNQLNKRDLRRVDASFFDLEEQAASCYLADIAFAGRGNQFIDPSRVRDTCEKFLECADITLVVIGKLKTHLVVRFYLGDISLSQYLLDKNYGTPVRDLLHQGTEEAKPLTQWIKETTYFLENWEDISESPSAFEPQCIPAQQHSDNVVCGQRALLRKVSRSWPEEQGCSEGISQKPVDGKVCVHVALGRCSSTGRP